MLVMWSERDHTMRWFHRHKGDSYYGIMFTARGQNRQCRGRFYNWGKVNWKTGNIDWERKWSRTRY